MLASCSTWRASESGTTYTFSNHCGEDLVVEAVSGTAAISLPEGEMRTVRTFDQQPDITFVVSRPDGTAAVHVTPGVATFAVEGDHCPSDH